jgi:hypothetical protein
VGVGVSVCANLTGMQALLGVPFLMNLGFFFWQFFF